MKNAHKAIATGIFAALTLAACAGGGTGGGQVAGGDAPVQAADACTEANPCTISFRWWGGEGRQALQLETIEKFEAQNPGIIVQPLPVSFDGYYDQLGVEMVAGTAPDVFTLDRSWPLEYGSRGGLVDLTAVPTLDLSAFPATALAPSSIDGAVFGVPNGSNATGLIVNADLFAAAGVPLPDDNTWTWEEFANVARQITENTPDGTFGAELRPWDFINAYTTQRDGVGLFNEAGEIAVSDETLADFFAMMANLTETGGAPSAAQTSELLAAGPAETLMGQGRSAMLFAPSNQIGAYTTASGADLRLMRIPGETEFAAPGTTVLPSQFFAIAASSAYPEAAGRLVNFLVNDLEAGAIMGVDRGTPVNEAVADHIAPMLTPVQQEQVNFMGRIAGYAGPTIAQPNGAGELQQITTRQMEDVLFGTTTPANAAAAWRTQMQAALNDAS